MEGKPEPPFGPPDCPWHHTENKEPKYNVVHFSDTLNGDPIHIGRVYDAGSYLIGTVIPKKNQCLYLTKDGELKSTSSYEILTAVSDNSPLRFEANAFESYLLFVAGGNEEQIYYCARVHDGGNTYYGWGDKNKKIVYIPRDPEFGPNILTENYQIMIHRFLDRLCICPSAPH